jgi:hypothetical protein
MLIESPRRREKREKRREIAPTTIHSSNPNTRLSGMKKDITRN